MIRLSWWDGGRWREHWGDTGGVNEAEYDWSESYAPWMSSVAPPTDMFLPVGVPVVHLMTSGPDFHTNLTNTINTAGKRVIVELPAGDHRLTSFRPIGASGDPTYAFGFWHTNLAGLVSYAGPDKTTVTMAANSMSQEQLDKIATMPKAGYNPLQMGVMRVDGTMSKGNSVFLAGIGFRAEDQQKMQALAPDLVSSGVFVQQPAPHQGIVIYTGADLTIVNCRFQGVGRAMTGQPPFEMSNLTTQASWVRIFNTEFDGRRAREIDPKQPRRCNPIMLNNEYSHVMTNVWLHHGNVSRYAANDQNRDTQGTYTVRRFKIEEISNTFNTDPDLAGGARLGGWSAVTPFGWESTKAVITLEYGTIHQSINETKNGQVPAHFQFTVVGEPSLINPQGGRFRMEHVRTTYTGWPELNGFIIGRVGVASHWFTDGFDVTMDVRHPDTGVRLKPYLIEGSWPPNRSDLDALGIVPSVNYLLKKA